MDFLENEELNGSELNEKIAAAGAILEKIAAENGVDLNDLSDEEVGQLVGEIVDGEKTAGDWVTPDVTYADVACELSKVAAYNGIDMSTVSREDYTEAFDAIATQLTDPDMYAEKVAAEQEYANKLAEADESGRVMAHAFADELGIAKDAGKVSDAYKVVKGKLVSAGGMAKDLTSLAGTKLENLGRYGLMRSGDAVGNAGLRVGGKNGIRVAEGGAKLLGVAANTSRRKAQLIAAGALGTAGLGAAGAGYAGKKGYDRYKKSGDEAFESAALEVAQQYVNKVASEDAVYERAAEILAENGYEL